MNLLNVFYLYNVSNPIDKNQNRYSKYKKMINLIGIHRITDLSD